MRFLPMIRSTVALLLSWLCFAQTAAGGEVVNVYSYRQPFLIEPIFAKFTEETGVEVNVVFAKSGLVERLKREGRNSPADILLTSEFGRMNEAVTADVLQPVESPLLNARIPQQYRDPENKWFGLTLRARNLFVSRDRADPAGLTYEDLAKPEWKGRICTRSGKHPYNIALVAAMIAEKGMEETEQWLTQVKGNLARKPQGNDRAQVKAIKEGVCDISIGNSYYYGKMLADENQRPWAEAVFMVFPNQADRGTHVNISGIALTASAPNPANGIRLMEFMAGETAQGLYAEANYEYPVNPAVTPSGIVASWGTFKADDLPLAEVVKYQHDAVRMIDAVDFDG